MSTPKISVIVPVYKVEKYLHRCIDSILAQTFTDFELLLINDGSPDNCGAICDEYAAKDTRIRVFHKENSGISNTREFGIKHVVGEYIQFIDSDDWIAPNMFQEMYNAAYNKNAEIVGCNFIQIFKNKKINTRTFYPNKDLFLPAVISSYWGVLWKLLIKRSLFIQGDIHFPPNLDGGEDYIVVIKLLVQAQSIICIDQYFYFYNKDNPHSTITNLSRQKVQFQIDATKLAVDFLISKGLDKKFKKEILERKFRSKLPLHKMDRKQWFLIFPESTDAWKNIDFGIKFKIKMFLISLFYK